MQIVCRKKMDQAKEKNGSGEMLNVKLNV